MKALIVCQPCLVHIYIYIDFPCGICHNFRGLGIATNSETNICLSLSVDEFLEITRSETTIERDLRNAAPSKVAHRIVIIKCRVGP